MKENKAEKWKSALMTMPDASFFELLRTVFGKIKTPFNKQHLLNDLEKFLLKPDIQKTLAAFINGDDAKIIAAVALFGEPEPEELERFFAGEFSGARLYDIIVNLEERFILYRFKIDIKPAQSGKNAQYRLALNPILDNVLAPFAADISALFPAAASAKTKQEKSAACLNDRILAGLLSFVLEWEGAAFYKREGRLRKQIFDAGKICFPRVNMEEMLDAFQTLGLFYASEDAHAGAAALSPDMKRFADIALLSARERMEYCAAGFLVYKEYIAKEIRAPQDIQAPFYKNRIKEAVNFIHSLMEALFVLYKDAGEERYFTETSIIRLIEVLKSKTDYSINADKIIKVIIKTGLVLQTSNSLFQLNHSLFTAHSSLLAPHCSIDSGLSVLVYPEIAFADAIELAKFLNIKEAGAVVRFELEKSSAVRAFDNSISAEDIINLLSRLSGKKLPDTLAYNLKDWEKRHGEVSIKKGVVLVFAKDKQYLAGTKPVSALITETLAPGVYLLNEDAEEEAVLALHNAGIDIIKRGKSKTKNANAHAAASAQNYFPAPSDRLIDQKIKSIFSGAPNVKKSKTKIKEKVFDQSSGRAILEKMTLSKTDRDELSARIDRRLILCEAQLKDANIRYEKLEARNMDYAGKQNIAKQAIAQGSPVEVVYPSEKGDKQVYGMPTVLEKEGAELILAITPAGKDSEVRIPLAKISLLRRIKKSVFEG